VQLGISTVKTLYPYLQDVTQNSIKVMWPTETAQDSTVEYGLTANYNLTTTDATAVTLHTIPISGLQISTTYHYRITSNGLSSADCTFTTAPFSTTGFTFISYGDNRANSSGPVFALDSESVNQAAILHNQKTIVIHVGDFVYTGSQNEWQPQFFMPARNILKNNVLYTAIGNHEYTTSGKIEYQNYFAPPSTGGSGTKFYYSFNYGNAHFISLNTNENYISGTAQYTWLTNDLDSQAATDAKWIIVFFHHPAYSSQRQYLDVRNNFVPLFETKGVNLVIQGDDHFYERHYKDGIYYLVTGGGGAPLADEGGFTTYREYYQKVFEYCVVEVGATIITVKAYDINNNNFDTFSLPKIPAQVASPSPADGAINVSATISQLNWAPANYANSYDVYLGTSISPTYKTNTTDTNYNPGTLSYSTTYYWRIDSVNSGVTATGNTWSFITKASPTSAGSSGKGHNKSWCGLMGIEVLVLIGLAILIRKKRRCS
jgi:acid phosphatase type 7